MNTSIQWRCDISDIDTEHTPINVLIEMICVSLVLLVSLSGMYEIVLSNV